MVTRSLAHPSKQTATIGHVRRVINRTIDGGRDDYVALRSNRGAWWWWRRSRAAIGDRLAIVLHALATAAATATAAAVNVSATATAAAAVAITAATTATSLAIATAATAAMTAMPATGVGKIRCNQERTSGNCH
jgi:hypothetical protein